MARITASVQLNSSKTLFTANETVSYDGRNFSVFCEEEGERKKSIKYNMSEININFAFAKQFVMEKGMFFV